MIKNSYEMGKRVGAAKRIDDVIGRYIVQLKNSFPQKTTKMLAKRNPNLKSYRALESGNSATSSKENYLGSLGNHG
jgi:hypothetical protein